MLHNDLLDSPSRVNIQEWRGDTESGEMDGQQSRKRVRVEKRYFHRRGVGGGER